jgi:hypothetical protein
LIFTGLGGDDLAQGFDVGDEDVGGLHHLDGEGSVNNIAAGEAEMKPAAIVNY